MRNQRLLALAFTGLLGLGMISAPATASDLPAANESAAPSTVATKRLAGDDRYETAVKISQATFNPGVPVAFVASGENYPDALAAAAAAGTQGGPMLLVKHDSVPQGVSSELARLRPEKIIVAGGTSSVSDAAMSLMKPLTKQISRLQGPDRYATAVDVSAKSFGVGTPVVYVASGENFPDALAAGAAAGAQESPVLLTRRDSLPANVAGEIKRLKPGKIVIAGLGATITGPVEDTLRGLGFPVERKGGDDRYATAAQISKAFPANTSKVYIASGNQFPDALAAAAAAGAGKSPVLLSPSGVVPNSVTTEIRRLAPSALYLSGGEATISYDAAARLMDLRDYGNIPVQFQGTWCKGRETSDCFNLADVLAAYPNYEVTQLTATNPMSWVRLWPSNRELMDDGVRVGFHTAGTLSGYCDMDHGKTLGTGCRGNLPRHNQDRPRLVTIVGGDATAPYSEPYYLTMTSNTAISVPGFFPHS